MDSTLARPPMIRVRPMIPVRLTIHARPMIPVRLTIHARPMIRVHLARPMIRAHLARPMIHVRPMIRAHLAIPAHRARDILLREICWVQPLRLDLQRPLGPTLLRFKMSFRKAKT